MRNSSTWVHFLCIILWNLNILWNIFLIWCTLWLLFCYF